MFRICCIKWHTAVVQHQAQTTQPPALKSALWYTPQNDPVPPLGKSGRRHSLPGNNVSPSLLLAQPALCVKKEQTSHREQSRAWNRAHWEGVAKDQWQHRAGVTAEENPEFGMSRRPASGRYEL